MRILRKLLTVERYIQYARKKLDLLEQGSHGICWVMMTFLFSRPQVRDGDRLGRICDIYCRVIYFDTLLRYVLSVTFCEAAVLKVMDQDSLCADEVIRCVYLYLLYIQNISPFLIG